MSNFTTGKIYLIKSILGDEEYIGCTIDRLTSRMGNYKVAYEKIKDDIKPQNSVFVLFDKYGVQNCKISLIEDYPCDSLVALRDRRKQIKLDRTTNIINPVSSEIKISKKEMFAINNQKNLIVSLCVCGGKLSNINKKKYFISNKHINFLNNIN